MVDRNCYAFSKRDTAWLGYPSVRFRFGWGGCSLGIIICRPTPFAKSKTVREWPLCVAHAKKMNYVRERTHWGLRGGSLRTGSTLTNARFSPKHYCDIVGALLCFSPQPLFFCAVVRSLTMSVLSSLFLCTTMRLFPTPGTPFWRPRLWAPGLLLYIYIYTIQHVPGKAERATPKHVVTTLLALAQA